VPADRLLEVLPNLAAFPQRTIDLMRG
jgi:hypothetical protein